MGPYVCLTPAHPKGTRPQISLRRCATEATSGQQTTSKNSCSHRRRERPEPSRAPKPFRTAQWSVNRGRVPGPCWKQVSPAKGGLRLLCAPLYTCSHRILVSPTDLHSVRQGSIPCESTTEQDGFESRRLPFGGRSLGDRTLGGCRDRLVVGHKVLSLDAGVRFPVAAPFLCRSMAGRLTVNQRIEVRSLAEEQHALRSGNDPKEVSQQ